MEQFPQKEIAEKRYRILLHSHVQHDLGKLDPPIAASILEVISNRLSVRPEYVGIPLKGTTRRLWKFRVQKYRAVFTINMKAVEVWVLALQPRDIVYRPEHIESLLRLALSIHQSRTQ